MAGGYSKGIMVDSTRSPKLIAYLRLNQNRITILGKGTYYHIGKRKVRIENNSNLINVEKGILPQVISDLEEITKQKVIFG